MLNSLGKQVLHKEVGGGERAFHDGSDVLHTLSLSVFTATTEVVITDH